MHQKEHPLVALARRAIEAYVSEGKRIGPPAELSDEMRARAGAFCSLHTRDEQGTERLRGCIGTIEPAQRNVAEEIIANAISAATRDPRFPAVTADELAGLEISVDVLTPAEPVDGLEDLDPHVYGVIVTEGRRHGLLLPDLDGVDTAEKQVAIALRKAWIEPDEDYALERFRVIRYH